MTCVLARGRFASELNLLYPYSSEPIDVKKTHLLGSLPAEALTAMLQDEVTEAPGAERRLLEFYSFVIMEFLM